MRTLAISLLLVLLNGCCECHEESLEDAIYFQFDSTFSSPDIDIIKIVRMEKNSQIKIDSVEIMTDELSGFRFSRTYPFEAIEKYWLYDYTIKVKTGAKYHITEITISGEKDRSPFCTCYENNKKKLKLDGVPIDLSGKGNAWFDNLVVLGQ